MNSSWKLVKEKIRFLQREVGNILTQIRRNLSNVEYKKDRTYRVIVTFNNGSGCGSGFFVTKEKLLTCFHVVFGTELRNIRDDSSYINTQGANEHEKLQNYYAIKVSSIEIEIEGNRYPATLSGFCEKYDAVLLSVDTQSVNVNVSRLDFKSKLSHEQDLFFAGFPSHHDYAFDKAPIAVHRGILSAFVNTVIGGDKYEHLQINSINLGGNSGAPLFVKNGRQVIGIINGNMNWGDDNLASIVQVQPNGPPVINKISFRVPLSIAYATTLKTLRSETDLLKDF